MPACPYGPRNLDNNDFHAKNHSLIPEREECPFFEYSKKLFREVKNKAFRNVKKCHYFKNICMIYPVGGNVTFYGAKVKLIKA